MKILLAVTTSLLPISARSDEVNSYRNGSSSSWCALSQIDDNGPNDWIKLPEFAVHVVRASKQTDAKKILSDTTFRQLNDGEIRPYLKDGEKISQGKFLYLVRAAAFYVDDKYELPKPAFKNLPLDASFSPSRDTLLIVNFALGYAGIKPRNLVLAIEAPEAIERSESVCLRTQ